MKDNNTTLTLYGNLESDAIRNAIQTRMEVLSVVPTLGAALEYVVLMQIAERIPAKAEPMEVSSEYAI